MKLMLKYTRISIKSPFPEAALINEINKLGKTTEPESNKTTRDTPLLATSSFCYSTKKLPVRV